MLAAREVNAGDREHRREKSTSYSKKAESLRRRIAANEKSRADLLRKREQLEQRTREAGSPFRRILLAWQAAPV
ncbi:MAG TPA: hypothetical protein PKD54_13485 [Pirellulaceae bacterium]|nr:hypothetical protein [Pirellulaceae bacterium]